MLEEDMLLLQELGCSRDMDVRSGPRRLKLPSAPPTPLGDKAKLRQGGNIFYGALVQKSPLGPSSLIKDQQTRRFLQLPSIPSKLPH